MTKRSTKVTKSKESTLGLKPGTVELTDHDEAWAEAFDAEKDEILKILKPKKLEPKIAHVGSTSVKGLKAKPIVDVLVGFNEAQDMQAALGALVKKRYRRLHIPTVRDAILLSKGEPPVYYIHLTLYGRTRWQGTLGIRNTLRFNPNIAKEYEALKQRLMEKYPDDRLSYTRGKIRFLEAVAFRSALFRRGKRLAAAAQDSRAFENEESLTDEEFLERALHLMR